MSFLTRYDEDRSRPPFLAALRDAAVRALLPSVLVFAAVVGIGLLIVGPLHRLGTAENGVNRWFASWRTPLWNEVTHWMSTIGNTEYVIGVGVLVALLVWWRTREWWFAVVPLIAISLQATWFVLAAWIVGRPRPEVEKLDPAPPTSSYPSGHVGASSALYFSFALMATRIGNPVLRRLAVLVGAVVPFVVTFARLYRGMHHVSDVVVGMLNGIGCVLLSWNYLRREPRGSGH
ncbi:phosphatase PAP2 family protein [Phycicoccus flavus]|uniref:phosphatase PAP2 family protein n=1 Tax=Phycicoccus flavus TaxID=2502783 RepID=UPI000FEBA66C|nr:phosphatase PAP2 family protein [Phycicoccus flavus]NHA68569.1 phosphatase PAP2 family protein [Phycicoccus flavus]